MQEINKIYTVGFFFCFVCVSCKSPSPKKNLAVAPDLKSTTDCLTKVEIWFETDKQFRAKIISDAPLFEDILFSGYYQAGDTYFFLVGFNGEKTSFKKRGNFYVASNLSEDDAKKKGWFLVAPK